MRCKERKVWVLPRKEGAQRNEYSEGFRVAVVESCQEKGEGLGFLIPAPGGCLIFPRWF